ncbi:MAG: alcohol dehydrogenase catalytic domain-containing protein, partial [Oscillospiraceae bacterium]|nr:alcohol dehydrogenase catalytic domain-containing protein [Oscillospiraceae bacterium]
MEGMMKCGIYKGIKQVAIEERPIPQIGPKDVLVKVLRAGICGSDTGAYLHGGHSYGIFENMEFGHEMVGKIVEKGEEVEGIELGDIVFVEPTRAKKAGIGMADMCGGFSEYVNVENAERNVNIYVWNKDINLDEAVLAEPLAVGTNGVIMQEPGRDEKVVVLGAGTIGLSAAAGLIARGLKNVAVVDVNETRLEMAKQLGAIPVNGKDGDLHEQLINLFGTFPGYHPQP